MKDLPRERDEDRPAERSQLSQPAHHLAIPRVPWKRRFPKEADARVQDDAIGRQAGVVR